MYGQNRAIHSRLLLLLLLLLLILLLLLLLLKLSYLLKINKRTNKKYLCDSNFEMHLYRHICIYERCLPASR